MQNDDYPTCNAAIRTTAMPADTNPAGDIFGGWLMAQMDLAAGNVAARRGLSRAVFLLSCRSNRKILDGLFNLTGQRAGEQPTLHGQTAQPAGSQAGDKGNQ